MRVPRPRGFALLEVAAVALLAALVAGVAVRSQDRLARRSLAETVVADARAVRDAALAFHEATGRWPADRPPGQAPPELTPYLPPGFAFDGGGRRLDWQSWELARGTPARPEARVLVGVSVTADGAALGRALAEGMGDAVAVYTLGTTHTILIAST